MEDKKVAMKNIASLKALYMERKNTFLNSFKSVRDDKADMPNSRYRKRIGRELVCLLIGLLSAAYICMIFESVLMGRAMSWRMRIASDISRRVPSFANAASDRKLAGIDETNPFDTVIEDKTEGGAASVPVSSLTLAGTLPGVGAWIRDDSGTQLILRGQKVKGYTLEAVAYGQVLLSANGDSYPLYLVLSGGSKEPAVSGSSSQVRGSKPPVDLSAIVPAKDNKEGAIPSELVNHLVMNPYDEIAKMRMVPSKEGGMEIQRIAPDSVLGLVGVVQGDVVKSLNGIEVTNLGDIANAVNSVVSGTRLDVTVLRSGKPVELKYQVK